MIGYCYGTADNSMTL